MRASECASAGSTEISGKPLRFVPDSTPLVVSGVLVSRRRRHPKNTPGRASSPGPFSIFRTPPGSRRQNRPVFRQHFLKPLRRSARAQVLAAQFLGELLEALPARQPCQHAALAALYLGFRRETFPTLPGHLKTTPHQTLRVPWGTSFQVATLPVTSRKERHKHTGRCAARQVAPKFDRATISPLRIPPMSPGDIGDLPLSGPA